MLVRIALSTLFFTAVTATAQVDPDKQPAGNPQTGESVQDPDRPAPRPVDVLGELQREKERLQGEIEFARTRAQQAKSTLASKLNKRGQVIKAIDAGTNAPPPSPVAQMRKARVMQPAEAESQDQDVLALVNGEAIRAGEFEELMEYLRSSPVSGDDNQRAQRVWFELVRTYSVLAAFPENDANARIGDAYAELEKGKSMAEVAKQFGTVEGAQEDGSIEITRNSYLGTKFEQLAFSLRAGQRSRPFVCPQGIATLEVESLVKGDSPEFDKVKARVVVIPWQAEPELVQQARNAATTGQVDIVVRSEALLAQLPPLWRPTPTVAAAKSLDTETSQLLEVLRQIDAMIQKLQDSDGDEAKKQLGQLVAQRAQVQQAIQELREKGELDADREEGAEAQPQPAPKAPVQPLPKKQ